MKYSLKYKDNIIDCLIVGIKRNLNNIFRYLCKKSSHNNSVNKDDGSESGFAGDGN